jgi:hypothetical protein
MRANSSENPYLSIATRNVFGLNPPRPQPPKVPSALPARVKLVGITTLCGKCALLRINLPAQPPEPAKELACILKVGQRDGPIEVVEIAEREGSVRVVNSGTVMVLMLERESTQPQNPPPPRQLPPSPVRAALRQ